MSSSDENERNEIDCDTCTMAELSESFDESLRIASEEAISLKKDYILLMDNSRNFDRIAAVTSSRMVHIFELNDNNGLTQIQRCDANTFSSKDNLPICGIRFANDNPATVFVAEGTGNIYMYDIRTKPTHVQTYHNSDIAPTVFTCFDVNANDTILCAGAQRSKDDASIVLFDVRKCSTLATYNDSHRDDLTQVKFHPLKPNSLASGSTDGLINVFNTSETDEYDALEYTLNSEISVQTINWHPQQNVMQVNDDSANDTPDWLSCITDTNDFQLFNVNESELLFQANRTEITGKIKRKIESDCYLVNCHQYASNGDIFLLAGSHFGGGSCLRSLTVHDKAVKPRHNFIENKQIIRCSLFKSKDNGQQILITAGEGGIVTLWNNFETSKSDSHKLKEKVKIKSHRISKPYLN